MAQVPGLGILGCGVIVDAYVRALKGPCAGSWRVIAVCDVDGEKARGVAATLGAVAVQESMDLLRHPEIDAVAVLLPNHLHAEATIQALECGKHVLVEKPMATTLEQCDAMIAAARAAGKLLMVGMTSRFRSAYRSARERLHAGAFGTLGFIAEYCNWHLAPNWYTRPWLKRAQTCGGGMFLQMGIHNLDRAVWLAGRSPRWVHAAIQNRSAMWADETGLATLGLDGGVLVQFQTDGICRLPRNETVLHCQDAVVCIDTRRVVVHGPGGQEALEFPDDGFSNELTAFSQTIQKGGPSPLSGEEGRMALALALACYQSHRTESVVRLEGCPWEPASAMPKW